MSDPHLPHGLADADSSERWVLATGLPGFVDFERLDAKRALDAELERLTAAITELEARRAALADELAAARDQARAETAANAEREIGAAVARIARLEGPLVERAADAALRAAATLVREHVRTEREAVCALVRAAVARRPAAAPICIRVSPSSENLVVNELSGVAIRVVGDPALQDGDLVLDYIDGQIDLRIDRLLEHMRAPVVAALTAQVGDGS